jgi:hypothetical protein
VVTVEIWCANEVMEVVVTVVESTVAWSSCPALS